MIEREYKPETSPMAAQIEQQMIEARARIVEAQKKLHEQLSVEEHQRWDKELRDATLELRGLEDLRESLSYTKAA